MYGDNKVTGTIPHHFKVPKHHLVTASSRCQCKKLSLNDIKYLQRL